MPHSARLIKIGSMVRVDRRRVIDRIPRNLGEILKEDATGLVLGYKMTDGAGIGLILKLRDGSTTWFFDEEIEPPTEDQLDEVPMKVIDELLNVGPGYTEQENMYASSTFKKDVGFKTSSQINYLANPINFFKWLSYSLKDVF